MEKLLSVKNDIPDWYIEELAQVDGTVGKLASMILDMWDEIDYLKEENERWQRDAAAMGKIAYEAIAHLEAYVKGRK